MKVNVVPNHFFQVLYAVQNYEKVQIGFYQCHSNYQAMCHLKLFIVAFTPK